MSPIVPTYSAADIRAAEVPYLEAGVPLMMRAARAVAEEAAAMMSWPPLGPRPRVLVLAGSGNNGGDALYAGALLADRGAEVFVLPVGSKWHEKAMGSALAAGATRLVHDELDNLDSDGASIALVIDGVLGTGSSGELREPALSIIDEVESMWEQSLQREECMLVLAVDIPSGLDPDTGVSHRGAMRADVTVTLGGAKSGFLAPPRVDGLCVDFGGGMAGSIVLVDIGIGDQLAKFPATGEVEVEKVIDATAYEVWAPRNS